ncbi:unnamed protein product [Caenorhabditis bovis]|uniref:C6 domain-containing protein n=1 Tax=Caenorhabditis bovis TaxID=2654633 RepID=A0A8S1E9K0_9PELO|nr:unnamed protein product [Caenorhabditis bovis]
MATSNNGVPSTNIVSTTPIMEMPGSSAGIDSTTAAMTTTTPRPPCTPDQITLGKRNDEEFKIDVTYKDFVVSDDNMSATMTITCTADAGNMAYMDFNVDEGGPSEKELPTVNADVVCKDGKWIYSETVGGVNMDKEISKVSCFQA